MLSFTSIQLHRFEAPKPSSNLDTSIKSTDTAAGDDMHMFRPAVC